MNRTFLAGEISNLEVKQITTQKGPMSLAKFRIHVTSGEHKKSFGVTTFGKQADALKSSANGQCVIVEGYLKNSSYEKNGVKNWQLEVIGTDVQAWGTAGEEPAPTKSETPEEIPF